MAARSRRGARLTVAQLCAERELKLHLLAGLSAADSEVLGVDVTEILDGTRLLVAGDVILTTGLTLKHDAVAQERTLTLLAERRVAGLGLATGIHFPEVPARMLAWADQMGVPLFDVPAETTFRSVVAFVFECLANRHAYQLRRRLSVQSYLLEALLEQKGTGHLVSSLSAILAATVILFDGAGRVREEAQGGQPVSADTVRAIWSAYEPAPGRPAGGPGDELVVGDLRVVLRDVWVQGRVESVLAVVYPAHEVVPEFTNVIASYVQRLLSLDLLKSRQARRLWKSARAGVLHDMILGVSTREELRGRALQYGLDPEGTYFFALIGDTGSGARLGRRVAPDPRLHDLKDELEDHAGTFFSVRKTPILTMIRGDAVVMMVQGPAEPPLDIRGTVESLRSWMSERYPGVDFVMGGSDLNQGVTAVRRAYSQAVEALVVARREPEGGRVRLFADLGPTALFLLHLNSARLQALAGMGVASLEQHDADKNDRLVETLEAYIWADRNVQRAAQQLWIHPNTLRYRLKKIEEILGAPLDSTRLLGDLYLCFRARAILRGQNPRSPDSVQSSDSEEMPQASGG